MLFINYINIMSPKREVTGLIHKWHRTKCVTHYQTFAVLSVFFSKSCSKFQTEQEYVVPPPEANQFNPPKEIQTIYVPAENAINIPDNFGVDVGSSFGYGAPGQVFPEYTDQQSAQLNANPAQASFSFDSPAFNPPQVKSQRNTQFTYLHHAQLVLYPISSKEMGF